MMYTEQEVQNRIRGPSFWIGAVLVGAGAIMLVIMTMSVLQIIQAPADSALVNWLITKVSNKELIFSGYIDNKSFEIRMSEVVQYLFFGLIGLVMISILTSIVNSLISGGIKLIMFSGWGENMPEGKKKFKSY